VIKPGDKAGLLDKHFPERINRGEFVGNDFQGDVSFQNNIPSFKNSAHGPGADKRYRFIITQLFSNKTVIKSNFQRFSIRGFTELRLARRGVYRFIFIHYNDCLRFRPHFYRSQLFDVRYFAGKRQPFRRRILPCIDQLDYVIVYFGPCRGIAYFHPDIRQKLSIADGNMPDLIFDHTLPGRQLNSDVKKHTGSAQQRGFHKKSLFTDIFYPARQPENGVTRYFNIYRIRRNDAVVFATLFLCRRSSTSRL